MSTDEPDGSPSGPLRTPATSRKAIYSVVCGIIAFACIYVTPFLGLLAAIPSVTSAIHSRREIADSQGQLTGDSLASIGLMIGGGAIVTVVLSWLLSLVSS